MSGNSCLVYGPSRSIFEKDFIPPLGGGLMATKKKAHKKPSTTRTTNNLSWLGWIVASVILLVLLTGPIQSPIQTQPLWKTEALATEEVPTEEVPTEEVPTEEVPTEETAVTEEISKGTSFSVEARNNRLIELDKFFRNIDVEAWLEAAGLVYDWTDDYFDARQPEEETLTLPNGSTKIVVSGHQVDVRGLYVGYPACVTTDVSSRIVEQNNTRKHLVDLDNGSTIYTNVSTSGDGEVTVWVDCSNWSQLDPAQ
jgi:hypothetical protein